MTTVAEMTQEVNPQLAIWSGFISHCAHRLGNADDTNDRIQSGWLALIENQKKAPDDVAFKIRTAVTLRDYGSVPFSSLIREDEEGDDFPSPEEQIADPNGDPETMLEALQGIIVDAASANLEEIVDREIGKAIEAGNTERATMIARAWKEYQATRLQPTKEPTPIWTMDVPKSEGGKGDWQILAEDAEEDDELASADIDLSHLNVSDAVINRRLGRPASMKAEQLGLHANEDMEPEVRPDTEDWPRGCWKALRDTWGTTDIFATLFGIWHLIDPKTDTEKVWSLRYLGSHLLKEGKIARKEQFYSLAVNLLNLPLAWLDCEDDEELWGEDAANVRTITVNKVDHSVVYGDRENARISNILYAIDWEGWEVEELPDILWPELPGLLESIESYGERPWQTKVYMVAMIKAAMSGVDHTTAEAAGWDAWFAHRLSRQGCRTRVREELKGASPKDANWAGNNVDKFTAKTANKVVGLTKDGLRVNGRGAYVEDWSWEKCIPNANRVWVEKGKEQSFLAAVKRIDNGQARIFATAYASALKYRQ